MKKGELIWRLVSIMAFASACTIAIYLLYQMLQNFG